ncbi:MAG: threonine synthase [Phototrophicales bacterium]|nr:MAG: threonine synthase [Phototrophicales bacterium]
MDNTQLAITGLQCVVCGTVYSVGQTDYVCPTCGPVGTLNALYNYHPHQYVANGTLTMWRQRDLLPLNSEPLVGLQSIGGTPLIREDALERLASALDVRGVCIKNEGLNLSGSLKDRASAMVVNYAVQYLKRNIIATASTGNAAAALACCCAAVPEAHAVIFVPASAPEGKIAQMLVFGATVLLVEGDYDTAFDLCWEACEAFGWYNRSTGINPITTEGKKTVVHEMAEQLGWQMPDVIVVSVGDGSIIGGVYKGCYELYSLGWIDKMPRLIGVQSSGSDALVYAWENNLSPTEMTPRPAETIADSISSRLPRDRAKALQAVRDSHGAFVRVPDAEILAAIPTLAQTSGVFAEPAAAATYAGAIEARKQGYIERHERILLLVTGNGLKDVHSAMQSVEHRHLTSISPTLTAVRAALQKTNLMNNDEM